MLKKICANVLMRKAIVFLCVFAATGIILGGTIAGRDDPETVSTGLLGAPRPQQVQVMTAQSSWPALTTQVQTMPTAQGSGLADMIQPMSAEVPDQNKPRPESWTPSEAEPRSDYLFEEPDKPRKPAQTEETEAEETTGRITIDAFVYSDKIPMTEALQLYTFEKCQEHGLDYPLVLALIWRESRFTLDAVGHNTNGTKDSGLMQINDINRGWLSKELGITNLMDPEQNIDAGTALLGRLTKKYGEHNALMAYQYGESGMLNKLKQGITTNKQIQLLYEKREYFVKLLTK